MTINKITHSSIDYPEEEYLSSRRRRRRSSSLDIDNQSLANDVIKSSGNELINPSNKPTKINYSIDLTLLLSNNVVIDLNDYPDILDMLAAHRGNKADNYPDDLSYGHYQLPRFLPRGQIGYAYAFYEEGEDGKIHFFEHDEDTGKKLEISLENACLKYRDKINTESTDEDEFNIYRSVEVIWVTNDWNAPPSTSIVFASGVNFPANEKVYKIERLKAFKQRWGEGGLIEFQNYLQQELEKY